VRRRREAASAEPVQMLEASSNTGWLRKNWGTCLSAVPPVARLWDSERGPLSEERVRAFSSAVVFAVVDVFVCFPEEWERVL